MFANGFLKQHEGVGLGVMLGTVVATGELWLKQHNVQFFVCPFFLKAPKLRRSKIWIQLRVPLRCYSPHEKVL